MNDTHAIPDSWLAAYYDGQLDPARRRQVEAHLPGCPACQHQLDELKALSSALLAGQLGGGTLGPWPAFWQGVESRLPARQPARLSPLEWLPGIGLLLANGLLQAGAAASLVWSVLLVTGQLAWSGPLAAHLDQAAASLLLGWPAWLLPIEWGGLGLSLFFVAASAGAAIVYLAWLAYEWRYRWRPAARSL